jgi:hypothetical protein
VDDLHHALDLLGGDGPCSGLLPQQVHHMRCELVTRLQQTNSFVQNHARNYTYMWSCEGENCGPTRIARSTRNEGKKNKKIESDTERGKESGRHEGRKRQSKKRRVIRNKKQTSTYEWIHHALHLERTAIVFKLNFGSSLTENNSLKCSWNTNRYYFCDRKPVMFKYKIVSHFNCYLHSQEKTDMRWMDVRLRLSRQNNEPSSSC